MKISVIMPTKNAERFLDSALESYFCQSWADKQLVLVDGGSEDKTLDIARKWRTREDVVLVRADRNATEAVVRGVTLSDGDVIGLLMADDWLEPGALEAVAAAFATDPRVDLVCGGAQQWVDTGTGLTMERSIPAINGNALHLARLLGIPYMAAFTFKRRAWDAMQGFASGYRYGADRDFLVRCRLAGLAAASTSAVVYNYRRHESSATLSENDDVVRDFLADHRVMASRWLKEARLSPGDRATIEAWREGETIALTERQVRRGDYPKVLGMLLSDVFLQPSAAVAGVRQVVRHLVASSRRRWTPGPHS